MSAAIHLPPVVTRLPIATKDGSMSSPNYGDVPVRTLCPRCRKSIMSQVSKVTGLGTWLIALILLLLPPFCYIPFFLKSCKDTQHTCPNCGNLLGINKLVG